jgi:hypothetical protein
MSRRAVVGVVLVAMLANGCAWAFQDRLHGQYQGRSEPHCSSSAGWATVDGLFAGLNAVGVVLAASDDTTENQEAVIAGGVIWALVHTASAITGASWASDCQKAYRQWNDGGARPWNPDQEQPPQPQLSRQALNPSNDPALASTYWCSTRDGRCTADEHACHGICNQRDEVWCSRFAQGAAFGFLCGSTRTECLTLRDDRENRKHRTDFGECVAQKVSAPPPPAPAPRSTPPRAPAPTQPAPPRGFFCASSPTAPAASICAREKLDCQRAREAAVGAVADLEECRLVESTWCYTAGGSERCAPTQDVCAARASTATGVTAACAEQR